MSCGDVRQTLIHHHASCHDCGASCDARNAQAWATNHVKAHPSHFVQVALEYAVATAGAVRVDPTQPPLF